MQRGPSVFSKKSHLINRRTVLGAIGGGVVAAALGDRLWPLVADSRAQGSTTVDMSRFGANAGGSVTLAPGGLHLMLMDLKGPLKQGTRVPVTLVFEKAGKIDVELSVEAMGAQAPQHR